jgi:uncharacterized protein (DUF2249 family)
MSDTCRCGELQIGYPVLQAKDIPHAIRHASIFGALDSLKAGDGLVVVAPHEPLPLLHQVDRRYGQQMTVSYLQEGPEDWHVQFVRVD